MELEGFDPEEPYPQAVLGNRWALLTALGVSCPKLNALRDLVYEDIDTERLGIGWWQEHLDPQRRILIADYLLQCFDAVHENMLEARLHLLHLPHFRREQSKFVAGAVTVGPRGRIATKLPPRTRPADDIRWAMINLHTAGVVRASASALDCLGGIIVGVAAVETEIVRTDFRRACRALANMVQDQSAALALLRTLKSSLEAAEAEAGPTGWLSWVVDYRNMLVHRGRRVGKSLLRSTVTLVGPSGEPLPRVEAVELLPREPGLSEIQTLAFVGPSSVLEEDAQDTLKGVVGSTRQLVEDVAQLLEPVWRTRRADPNLLRQPAKQWKLEAVMPSAFRGYRPGSVQFTPDMFVVAPEWTVRLKSAALDDRRSSVWANQKKGVP